MISYNHRQIYKTVFLIQIFVPSKNFLECLKGSISIDENWRNTNTKLTNVQKNKCKICHCISVASILTNTNITFQAILKIWKGSKNFIRKSVLCICHWLYFVGFPDIWDSEFRDITLRFFLIWAQNIGNTSFINGICITNCIDEIQKGLVPF
jgi:hypothetical protein